MVARASRLLAMGAAVLISVLAAAPAASAVVMQAELSPDERSAGLWYTQRLKFDEIREQGLTGEGITIAVIDDAINLDAPELQGADIEVRGQFCHDKETGAELPAVSDDIARSHGTSVVSMLVGNGVAGDGGLGTQGIVPDAKILFYSADSDILDENGVEECEAYDPLTETFESDREITSYDPADGQIVNGFAFAVNQAVKDGADIVNVSSVHSIWESAYWSRAQIAAMRAGVAFVAGTENPVATASVEYGLPYGMNGVVAVGGVDNDGKVISGENMWGTGPADAKGSDNLAFASPGAYMLAPSSTDAWGPSLSSGTSLATPLVAGTIALGLEKYPDATAFQVLQAMIRTTGKGGLSEPEWHNANFGYGIVNPTAMLAVDPTQYPDENPVYVTDYEDPRCGPPEKEADTCLWAMMTPEPAEVWYEEPAKDNPVNASLPIFLIGGLGVLVLIGVAVIVPIAVVRSRNKRKNLTGTPGNERKDVING